MKGYILISKNNKVKILILELLSTVDSSVYLCLRENGDITRYRVVTDGEPTFTLLTIEDQILAYNDVFYKYVEIPEHLKKYIQEKTK